MSDPTPDVPAPDAPAHDATATAEEHALLAAVEHLAAQSRGGERPASVLPAAGDGDPGELRAACELLGLLPYALDRVAPPAALRGEILAQVRRRTASHVIAEAAAAGDEVAAAGPVTANPVAANPVASAGARPRDLGEMTWAGKARRDGLELEAVDATLYRPEVRPADPPPPRRDDDAVAAEAEPAASPAPPAVRPPARRRARRGRALPLAMAAGLALALVGLGYLAGLVRQQGVRLGTLEEQLRAAAREAALLGERNAELERVRERFAMITTVAQRAYPLRAMPAADRRLPPLAHDGEPTGIVYVCGNHQQWYLNLQGLAPPPEDKQYNLWFLTETGAIGGGVLEVRADRPAEAEAPSMPVGTRGFAVTLEDSGPHSEPEGPFVLLGDDAVSL